MVSFFILKTLGNKFPAFRLNACPPVGGLNVKIKNKFPTSNLELRTSTSNLEPRTSNQNVYDSFLRASRSLPIISLISSFLQVPTLNLYQLLLREVPNA